MSSKVTARGSRRRSTRIITSIEHMFGITNIVAPGGAVHINLDLTLAAYVGEDVVVRYDPRDMAELRVYFGDAFLCRAINPELAGETVALKDIIRARNQRRRELRTTLTEREATVEALLRLRRGEEPDPEPLFPELELASSTPPARPRLKSYFNE